MCVFCVLCLHPAGIVFGKDLLSLTGAEVRRTFEVNVLAHFTLVRHLLPAMVRAGKGVVVTMSSAMGLRGGYPAFASSV
jgi:all-trans-retinol dehydrogenase (NAD+)